MIAEQVKWEVKEMEDTTIIIQWVNGEATVSTLNDGRCGDVAKLNQSYEVEDLRCDPLRAIQIGIRLSHIGGGIYASGKFSRDD